MLVEVKDVTLQSVWAESFKGREGDTIEFYRSLCVVPGEPPMQLGVAKDDYDDLRAKMGNSGTALVEIDARPGNRVRVYLKDVF